MKSKLIPFKLLVAVSICFKISITSSGKKTTLKKVAVRQNKKNTIKFYLTIF